jgi:hypothetical protein
MAELRNLLCHSCQIPLKFQLNVWWIGYCFNTTQNTTPTGPFLSLNQRKKNVNTNK